MFSAISAKSNVCGCVSHLQGVKELGQIKVLSLQGLLAHQLVQYVEDFFGFGKVLHLEQSTSHVHVDVPH